MGVNTRFTIADDDLDLAYIDDMDYDWQHLPDIDDYEQMGKIRELVDLRNNSPVISWLHHHLWHQIEETGYTEIQPSLVEDLISDLRTALYHPELAPKIFPSAPLWKGELDYSEDDFERMQIALERLPRIFSEDYSHSKLWVEQG